MFSFIKDLQFLEQLVFNGFNKGYLLFLADSKLFYQGNTNGIYKYFRSNTPINGIIEKPTGTAKHNIIIKGKYFASWKKLTEDIHYCLIEINN